MPNISKAIKALFNDRKFSIQIVASYVIGLTVSVYLFTFVNVIFYKSLEFPDSERLVFVEKSADGLKWCCNTIDSFAYQYLKENNRSFEQIGAIRMLKWVNFSYGQNAARPWTAEITADMFRKLETNPILGRGILPDDGTPGAPKVAVISYKLWRDTFLSDANIIGANAVLHGQPVTVVGVMPEGFSFPIQQDLWIPLQVEPLSSPVHDWTRNVTIFAKLNEGVSLEQANIELSNITSRLKSIEDNYYEYEQIVAWPASRLFFQNQDELILFVSVALVFLLFLIGFNIGNLLLARENEKIHETAIFRALGARSHQLISQNLLESFILSFTGLVIALLLSFFVLDELHFTMQSVSSFIPYWWQFELSSTVLSFVILITLAIWLVSSLVPAVVISRLNFHNGLKIGSMGAGSKSVGKLSNFISGLQITLTAVLLSIAIIYYQQFDDLASVDVGIEPELFVSGNVMLPTTGYPDMDKRLAYIEKFKRVLKQEPGIDDVTATSYIVGEPHYGGYVNFKFSDINVRAFDGKYPSQAVIPVDKDYFDVLSLAPVDGRLFNENDRLGSKSVAIVSEHFASRWWPNESAVGKQVQFSPERDGEWITIIGVIPNLLQNDPWSPTLTAFYRPFSQAIPVDENVIKIVARSADFELALRALHKAAKSVDVTISVDAVDTLDNKLSSKLNYFIFLVKSFGISALLSLLLAASAIYALNVRHTNAKAGEYGLLRALGAKDSVIQTMLLQKNLKQLLVSLCLGFVVTVFLKLNTYAAISEGLIIYINVAIVLFLTIFISSYFPLKSTLQKSPADMLKME